MGNSNLISTCLLTLLGLCLVGIEASGQGHYANSSTTANTFLPQGFEKSWSFQVNGSMDKVYELVQPERMGVWQETRKYDASFFTENKPMKPGAMFMKYNDAHGVIWVGLANVSAKDYAISYIHIAYDGELFYEKFECEPNEQGGTQVTYTVKSVGLSSSGNKGVKEYFEKNAGSAGSGSLADRLNKALTAGSQSHD